MEETRSVFNTEINGLNIESGRIYKSKNNKWKLTGYIDKKQHKLAKSFDNLKVKLKIDKYYINDYINIIEVEIKSNTVVDQCGFNGNAEEVRLIFEIINNEFDYEKKVFFYNQPFDRKISKINGNENITIEELLNKDFIKNLEGLFLYINIWIVKNENEDKDLNNRRINELAAIKIFDTEEFSGYTINNYIDDINSNDENKKYAELFEHRIRIENQKDPLRFNFKNGKLIGLNKNAKGSIKEIMLITK